MSHRPFGPLVKTGENVINLLGEKKKQTKKVSYNALYKKIDRLVSTALEAVAKLLHVQAVF